MIPEFYNLKTAKQNQTAVIITPKQPSGSLRGETQWPQQELVQPSRTAQPRFHSARRTTGVYRIYEVNSHVHLTAESIHSFCLSVETEEAASLPSDSCLHSWQNSTESRRAKNAIKDGLVWYFLKGVVFWCIFTSKPILTRAGTAPFK